MEKIKVFFKPFMALFLVVVFVWLLVITRYQYFPRFTEEYSRTVEFYRIDRLTGGLYRPHIFRDGTYGWVLVENLADSSLDDYKELLGK
jgi:hypothetical protein